MTLTKALVLGYEVEPEFKVGDKVIFKYMKKICIFGEIVELNQKLGVLYAKVNDPEYPVPQEVQASSLKHATPEEIEIEKERRFWLRNGRAVWELRKNDVLIAEDGEYVVVVEMVLANGNVIFVGGVVPTQADDVREGYKVLCFAENRLDI